MCVFFGEVEVVVVEFLVRDMLRLYLPPLCFGLLLENRGEIVDRDVGFADALGFVRAYFAELLGEADFDGEVLRNLGQALRRLTGLVV